jgi:hypothetical protein
MTLPPKVTVMEESDNYAEITLEKPDGDTNVSQELEAARDYATTVCTRRTE